MNIGLIAHDAKKKLMQNFCIAYRGILSKHSLYATCKRLGYLTPNEKFKQIINQNSVAFAS